MHTPRYVIDALVTKDPKPFSAIVSNMGLLRAAKATRALNTIKGHFKQHAMQNFSIRLRHDGAEISTFHQRHMMSN
jgi:hypothetical protein